MDERYTTARVTVERIDIPLSNMVILLLKLAVASIPAMFIFYAVLFSIGMGVTSLFSLFS